MAEDFQKIIVKQWKEKGGSVLVTIGFKRVNKGKTEGSFIAIPKNEVNNLIEKLKAIAKTSWEGKKDIEN